MAREIPDMIPEEELARRIIDAGAVDIRDVDGGQDPFLYSSGNYGPGYLNIKGLVGRQDVFKVLTQQTALRLATHEATFDFIAANATGGMVPGYQVREDYQAITGRDVPYIYVRNTRKIGGHQEYTTGLTNNPEIPVGSRPLVFEELVNYAQTTANSAEVLKDEGYPPEYAGTLVTYDNPVAVKRIQDQGLTLVWSARLPTILAVGREMGRFSQQAVDAYMGFLEDPAAWQQAHGYARKDLANE